MRVKSAIGFGDIEDSDFIARDSDRLIPGEAVGEPFFKPDFPFGRADEEFHLHLFKFAGAEGEVAGVDLIAKSFADLGDAEGEFFTGDFENIFELNEHGLSGLGAQIGQVAFVLDRPDIGFEHEVELAGFREFPTAGVHFFARFLRAGGGGELIGAESIFAGFTIDHGIGEGGLVTAGLPDGSAHEDGAVHADDVVSELGHGTPPVGFEITFEFCTKGAVVPGSVESTVDLRGLKNEATALAKGHNLFHTVIGFHVFFWILEKKLLAMIGVDEHPNIKSDTAEDTTPDVGFDLALVAKGGSNGGGIVCPAGDFWPGGWSA